MEVARGVNAGIAEMGVAVGEGKPLATRLQRDMRPSSGNLC
jgi:hypothetical protein